MYVSYIQQIDTGIKPIFSKIIYLKFALNIP